ncbi:GlsB/YeaQ/YmgE family stress response membrane protein [Streptosporangium subroseum]|uniref:GlsB/YeaQ/YmgE family stress response membrane protein n=1 Tax=Streptosporangium subroseum TaxID=106412 RepID=UPI0034120471
MITFIISAIIVGAITGGLGRLLIPGRQEIGMVATIIAGIVAAFVGSGIAYLLGFEDKTWIVLIVQLVLAVICVGVVSNSKGAKQGRG